MAVLAVISVVRVPLGGPRATAEFMQPQDVPVKFAWQRTWSSREGCISLARALLVFHLTEKCESRRSTTQRIERCVSAQPFRLSISDGSSRYGSTLHRKKVYRSSPILSSGQKA